MKFNNSVLLQKSFSSLYTNFILNLYFVYKLNDQTRNPSNDFTIKNCLLVTAKLTRSAIESKFVYNGRGKAFEGAASQSFDNEFARNVAIFGNDHSSLSHTDNLKNDFLLLGEGPTDDFIDSVGIAEKNISISFTKENNFFEFIYNGDESYLYVNKREICKFKGHAKITWYEFCLGSLSNHFTKDEVREISLNATVCSFSIDHNPIEKEDVNELKKMKFQRIISSRT